MDTKREVDQLCARKALLMTDFAYGKIKTPDKMRIFQDEIASIDERMRELRQIIEASDG